MDVLGHHSDLPRITSSGDRIREERDRRNFAAVRRSTTVVLILSALSLCAGGCASVGTLFGRPSRGKVTRVRLVSANDSVPAACRFLANVSATDGKACVDCTFPYEGTRDGAIAKLKRKTASAGGNLLQLDEGEVDGMITHYPGYEVTLSGKAFACTPDPRDETPN